MGDLQSWHWIQDFENWQQSDYQRWSTDRTYDRFKRRDGATCRRRATTTAVTTDTKLKLAKLKLDLRKLKLYVPKLLDHHLDAVDLCLCDDNCKS